MISIASGARDLPKKMPRAILLADCWCSSSRANKETKQEYKKKWKEWT
jgi:hypothetical protein